VSGDQLRDVELFGPLTASLVQALPEIERRLDRRITVVGGLAVLSRLGSAAHRVTSDVDTVNRRLGGEPGQLDVLLATGATAVDGAGAMVATPTGDVRVDVLEVSEETGPVVRAQLAAADVVLKQDAALHVERWFGTAVERSLRLIRTTPSGSDTTPDTVALVGELLLASLER